jgi:ectoine hydroxylase-related dioxygenase (phytanoyl-CoA dioxygenase family)
MMSVVANLSSHIRRVTPDEVAHYEEYGWVMLRELVSRELAAELLAAAKDVLEVPQGDWEGNRTRGRLALEGIEPFRSVAFSAQMADAARTLINRARLSDVDVPIKYHADSLWAKGPGATGTGYHQDDPVRPGDRPGVFNMWLALDEVTPDMGGIRFLNGVHREGPLGTSMGNAMQAEIDAGLDEATRKSEAAKGILAYYPKLTDLYEWSETFHYQPGDATVHHGWMVHGGPDNTSDRHRWGYILEYMPADTRFFYDDDVRRISGVNQQSGLEKDHPVVYTPPAAGAGPAEA